MQSTPIEGDVPFSSFYDRHGCLFVLAWVGYAKAILSGLGRQSSEAGMPSCRSVSIAVITLGIVWFVFFSQLIHDVRSRSWLWKLSQITFT